MCSKHVANNFEIGTSWKMLKERKWIRPMYWNSIFYEIINITISLLGFTTGTWCDTVNVIDLYLFSVTLLIVVYIGHCGHLFVAKF